VLHHTGFSDQHRARGSSVFGADADTIIRLDRETKAKVVSLTMTKQKDAPEWEKKKYVRLDTIIVSMDPLIDSLVAVTGEAVAAQKEEQQSTKARAANITRDLIEATIIKHFTINPDANLTNMKLAEAINSYGGMGCEESTIRTTYLPKIRGDKDCPASKFYNTNAGRWCSTPAED